MRNVNQQLLMVGVCGAQNTGKSTFINDMINTDPSKINYHIVEGKTTYREKIKELNLPINRKGDFSSQKIIFDTLCDDFCREHKMRDEDTVVLMDRTPIDALVYTLWLYFFDKQSNITKEDIEKLVGRLLKMQRWFDVFVYFPTSMCENIPLEARENRDINEEYRNQIDMIFHIVLYFLGECLYTKLLVMGGDRQERIDKFIKFLTDAGDEYNDESSAHLLTNDIISGIQDNLKPTER